MKNEAKTEIDTLQENPNSIFRLKKGGSCIRGKDGMLGCNEIAKRKVW